ncbi:MAG: hypothetical protein AB3N28_00210 [Kordiimonas sp.]
MTLVVADVNRYPVQKAIGKIGRMTKKIDYEYIGQFEQIVSDAIKQTQTISDPDDATLEAVNYFKVNADDRLLVELELAQQIIGIAIATNTPTPLEASRTSAFANIDNLDWTTLPALDKAKYGLQKTDRAAAKLLFDDINNLDLTDIDESLIRTYGSLMWVLKKIGTGEVQR